MFILRQWTVLNMHDWVEEALVVSESKQRLVEYHAQHGGTRTPLIDLTQGESLQQWCENRNRNENRIGIRRISEACYECYWSIDTIEVIPA